MVRGARGMVDNIMKKMPEPISSMKTKQRAAFTLVELLVVIAIIMILARIMVPSVANAKRKALAARWQAYAVSLRADTTLAAMYLFDSVRDWDSKGGLYPNYVRNLAVGYQPRNRLTHDASNLDGFAGGDGAQASWSTNKVARGGGRWGQDAGWYDGASWLRTGTENSWTFARGVQGPDEFTVISWCKPTGRAESYGAVVSDRWSDVSGWLIYVGPSNWEYWTGNGSAWQVVNGPSVTLNEWTQVAVTFKSTSGPDVNGIYTGDKRLYINGKLVAGPTSQTYKPNNWSQMDMGINPDWAWRFLGYQDFVAVWARELPPREIEDNYKMGRP